MTGRIDAKAEGPILWVPDAMNWLIKDPNAGKDWRPEEKGMTEDELVGWHHRLSGHEFEQVLKLVMDRETYRTAVHGVAKSQTHWATELKLHLPAMQEIRVWSLGQKDPLENGMASHSSILTWRITWTEEPGGLWSMSHGRPQPSTYTKCLKCKESDMTEWLTLMPVVAENWINI